MKILLVLEYYVYMNYGFRLEYYRGNSYNLGSTGQEKTISEAICRDLSCIVFEFLEKLGLEGKIISPVIKIIQ